ncbi:hypothetical protein ABFX02_12G122500 [Erythranthe guttata]
MKIIMINTALLMAVILMVLPDPTWSDPRSKTVKLICGEQSEHNATLYVPNFVATMENISAQIRNSGFGLSVTGPGNVDTNYGLAQCYGDLSPLDCVLCYAEARTVLPQCFPANGGRIFLDGCFMRAENYSFFHEYSGPNDVAVCGNETRTGPAFRESVRRALNDAVLTAPEKNGYGRAEVAVSGDGNGSAYVLADCWRTLNASACRSCLKKASSSVMKCLPLSNGRALNAGCFLRYSNTNFLNPIPQNRNSKERIIVIVMACVSAAAVLIIGAVIGVYTWKQRIIQRKRKGSDDTKKYAKTLNDSSLNFKYSTLEKATASFDEANKLGRGGFGTVYKGVLPDGREIAVKRLFFNNKHRASDFYNEVKIISSVEHKNLVRLLGCSCSGPESLLVYEFLPNTSLDRFIFDSSKGKGLNWEKRFEIIIGTAEGLVYLHENGNARIIHRDIKASNILLDSRLRAKIADFGLARSFQEDKSHISTAIAGTLGYMAPEYLAHGQLTEKADVYSFGVLLLEIVTGRQNNRSNTSVYAESLVTITWKRFQQRTVEEIFDSNLVTSHNYNYNIETRNDILRVVHVGLLCTQEIASLRPSMSKALEMLVKKDEDLPAPTSPPFVDDNTMELNGTNEHPSPPLDYGNSDSAASMSQSIFFPR